MLSLGLCRLVLFEKTRFFGALLAFPGDHCPFLLGSRSIRLVEVTPGWLHRRKQCFSNWPIIAVSTRAMACAKIPGWLSTGEEHVFRDEVYRGGARCWATRFFDCDEILPRDPEYAEKWVFHPGL